MQFALYVLLILHMDYIKRLRKNIAVKSHKPHFRRLPRYSSHLHPKDNKIHSFRKEF